MTTGTLQEIITIILIVLGTCVLVGAAFYSRQILKIKQEEKYLRRWQILFSLILFFIISYVAMIILVLLGRSNYLVVSAGVIFLLGSLFVYLVSQMSSSNIKDNLLVAAELNDERSKVSLQALDLENRFKRLQTATEIARSISGIQSTQRLLQEAVDPIQKQFNLYYVGIFLVDESGHFAVLQAGTGEAGKAMILEHHKLPIGETSMVGWTIFHRQARIALDVGKDAIRFANPHLPDTHSEMALPLISGDHVIGALTIQSTKPEAFDENDIIILKTISDTLAIALENARRFQDTQSTIEELRAVQRSAVKKAWSETSLNNEEYEFTDTNEELFPDTTISAIDVPLVLREQIIGELHLEGQQDWTPEERNLVEAVATQAALAMENARLLEESRQMALRERLAADITGKVWSSPNTDFILQTAVKELGRALRADEAIIELKTI